MKTHPVADLFPMLPDDELADLAADIKANGLHQPIVIKDRVLIDGRNRLAACKLAGVEPSFVELDGEEPVAYILSANLARRHMSKGQRAMAAAKTFPQERSAASAFGVGYPLISKARSVFSADPDLANQVLAGTIPLNDAYQTVQDRKKDAERLTQQREQLRSLAPDLDDQVSEEVLQLAEALTEAQDRQRKSQEERQDALTLLSRIVDLAAPRSDMDGWLDAWADRLGTVAPHLVSQTRLAGEALIGLAERMER